MLQVIDDPDELVRQITWCEKEKCYLSPEGIRAFYKGNGEKKAAD